MLMMSCNTIPPYDWIAWFTDSAIRIPGTSRTIGADGVLSLIPGVGTLLGLAAGWFRGVTDLIIRTGCDVMMTIPAIAVLVLVGTSLRVMTVEAMALIVAGLSWMVPARAVRAQVLSLRERPWIDVARLNGSSGAAIVLTELLPNLAPAFVTSGIFAFLASMDNYAISIFFTNAWTKTLPIQMIRRIIFI
jgi:peptide/nickel transport system permease protein